MKKNLGSFAFALKLTLIVGADLKEAAFYFAGDYFGMQ